MTISRSSTKAIFPICPKMTMMIMRTCFRSLLIWIKNMKPLIIAGRPAEISVMNDLAIMTKIMIAIMTTMTMTMMTAMTMMTTTMTMMTTMMMTTMMTPDGDRRKASAPKANRRKRKEERCQTSFLRCPRLPRPEARRPLRSPI